MIGPSIDIFCRVVDNYGDIGVCWRFAQCLRHDQSCAVRLIVDDMNVFSRIEPRLDRLAAYQDVDGITILRWDDDTIACHYESPAVAVIEAFACALPETVIAAMTSETVWIDLEYLSAETWVDTHHAIPSPHPATGLTKTVFFPGFTPHTGGLIREADLIAARTAFQNDPRAQNDWRSAHGMPPLGNGIHDISLFCYDDAPLGEFLTMLDRTGQTVRIFAPEGVAGGINHPKLRRIAFLRGPDYDRLLWTCGVNFVRGEDSFIRAQWAARPMVWQIYPQAGDHHFVKLTAFLSRYGANLPRQGRDLLEKFMVLWNERGRGIADRMFETGPAWLDSLPALTAHAGRWADALARQDDLATRLVRFIREQKSKKDTQE